MDEPKIKKHTTIQQTTKNEKKIEKRDSKNILETN